MKKIEVNRMECRYPSLFKVMWLAIVVGSCHSQLLWKLATAR